MSKPTSGGFCSKCHKRLDTSLRYPHKGKIYCYDCYSIIQKRLVDQETKLQETYTFLKKIFEVAELDEEVIGAIDHAINKDNRTIAGIYLTFVYYFKIMSNNPSEQRYIGLIIKNNYEKAKKFYAEQRQIREQNNLINLNVAPVHLTIDPRKLHREDKKDKIPYKMEEL